VNRGVVIPIVAVAILMAVGAYLILTRGPAVRTIELSAKDFGFNGNKGGPILTVKAGETVRIVMKNDGGALHEVKVVANVTTPDGKEPDEVFSGADMGGVKPGETGEITFVASKGGKYFYACYQDQGTSPKTHADVGMFGEFIVNPQ